MKKIVTVLLLVLSFAATVPSIASAQTTTKGGQVIRQENGVMYVTNEVTGEEDASLSANINSGVDRRFDAPRGYASSFGSWLSTVLSIIMFVAAMLVLFQVVYGAVAWITSGGDKGKIDSARQRMVSAVIGLIIVASSYAIFRMVLTLLGFESLEEVFNNISIVQ